MPTPTSAIVSPQLETIAAVNEAVSRGIARPAWLDHVKDGTLSFQDRNAVKKLRKSYVPSDGGQLVSLLLSGGRHGVPDPHGNLVGRLRQLVDGRIEEQGFFRTLGESIKDLFRGSVVVPRA